MLTNTGRTQLMALFATQAAIYNTNAEGLIKGFAVSPQGEQRLIAGIQQQSDFLQMINMMMVNNQKGDNIRLGVSGLTASRTKTSNTKKRQPAQPADNSKTGYMCEQTDFDTAISYAEIDAWAHDPMFRQIVSQQILQANALSMISMGWNGTSVADNSNKTDNPLLEDVSKGWLKQLKDNKAANFLDSLTITIGDGTESTKTVDQLVLQAKNKLGIVQRMAPDLVCILGTDLIAYNEDRLYTKNGLTPTEKARIEMHQVIKSFGGLPAYEVPYFPSKGVLVTSFKNLSIYIQRGSERRRVEEEPAYNRVSTYSNKNIAFVVQDYDKMAYIDSNDITIPA